MVTVKLVLGTMLAYFEVHSTGMVVMAVGETASQSGTKQTYYPNYQRRRIGPFIPFRGFFSSQRIIMGKTSPEW